MNGHVSDDGANAKDTNSDPMDHDGAPGDDGDEDDPVVHEIPVFIAKSLQNNLYLFQVRVPFHFSFDPESILNDLITHSTPCGLRTCPTTPRPWCRAA